MSDYTTQLRFICESYANRTDKPQPQSDVDETIRLARTKLFSFDYPIFDENYREHLESKIISHFYTREIGLETVGLFKHHLKNKMREMMPYYNQMYLSEKLKFDPFMNTEMNDSHNSIREELRDAEGNRLGLDQTATDHDLTSHADRQDGKSFEQQGSATREESETRDSASQVTGQGTSNLDSSLTKSGTEKNTVAGTDVLVKHSDTPLGSITATTAVGDNSNYLSDVTETVTSPTTDAKLTFDNRKDTTKSETIDETNTDSTAVEQNESTEKSDNETHGAENSTGQTDNKLDESTVTEGTHTENTSESAKESGTYDYFGRMFGKTGSETYSEMLQKFRQTFLNIDMDIIRELEPLFMLVW